MILSLDKPIESCRWKRSHIHVHTGMLVLKQLSMSPVAKSRLMLWSVNSFAIGSVYMIQLFISQEISLPDAFVDSTCR